MDMTEIDIYTAAKDNDLSYDLRFACQTKV